MKTLRYVLLAVILGCGGSGATVWARGESGFTPSGSMTIEAVGSGLKRPVYVTAPSGDSRLFVVEQAGVIRVVKDGAVLSQPFLDIQSQVHSDAEQGLLSMAFHPGYRSNGYFFVYFLDRTRHIRIERFRVSADADVADAASGQTLLSIDKPGWEHNGGLVKFGPDGMLFIGTGDGGNSKDFRATRRTHGLCSAKFFGSMSIMKRATQFPRATPSALNTVHALKSGREDCAIHGASPSTAPLVSPTSLTSVSIIERK